jgi:hypothetical protein
MADSNHGEDGGGMRGYRIIDRDEAIRVIRRDHDKYADLVMALVDCVSDIERVNADLVRQRTEMFMRRALMQRETALITLAGDWYEEPPDWDWEKLLDNVGADQLIINLAAEFQDEGGD